MVSPVSVPGASNHTARPRSTTSPLLGSFRLRSAIRRGAGKARPVSAASASAARGPLSRTTDSAPGWARDGVGVPSA